MSTLGGGGKDGTDGPAPAGVFIMDYGKRSEILGRMGDRPRTPKAAL